MNAPTIGPTATRRRPGNCRSCGAPLKWTTSAARGKAMPLDPGPHPQGNVALELDLLGGEAAHVLGAEAAAAARDRGEPLWMPHHATCPQAERWHR